MRKIKKFKINIHHKEISRRLRRSGVDLSSLGLPDEIAFREFLSCLAAALEPALVFESFQPGDTWKELTSMPGLAFSACALTLGAQVDSKLEAIEPSQKPVALTAMDVFMDDGARFVLNIIQDEAEKEGLELGPIQYLARPGRSYDGVSEEKLVDLLNKLESSKVGIEAAPGRITPFHTAVFSVPWLAKHKTKSPR